MKPRYAQAEIVGVPHDFRLIQDRADDPQRIQAERDQARTVNEMFNRAQTEMELTHQEETQP